jgi:BirA family biotin operon repressor/biotin-[acetyl-CoA-carboxylase] ligase
MPDQSYISFYISRLDEVVSTNDTAAQPHWKHGDVIRAEYQSGGRGQRGNRWASERGVNLMFSVVFQPRELAVENQFYLSKIVSIALVHTLADFGIEAAVKWPNDLYIGDRKTAGILIENDLMGSRIAKSIIGIGLNVNQLEFDPALPNPVSLALAVGRAVDREAVFDRFLNRLAAGYGLLQEKKYAEIDTAYSDVLYRKTGLHRFQEPGGPAFQASIAEVLPGGELVLLRDDGSHKSYLFKEIEFVI